MKKLSLIFLTVLILSQTTYAFAELPRTGLLNSRIATTSSGENQANLTANLKERAKREITRRLNFLNELLVKLDKIKKISDSDKQTLKTQIQTQIDGLNALSIKIEADTDLTTLKTDVKSIINGYYIFAFFRVKIELLVAAERMSTAADNLNTIYTKLQTRVTDAKNQGKDTSVLDGELSEMLSKITDAKSQHQVA
ncbi:MAG TPA: hypothetical protein VES68_01575, partial [Candidatus Sulfotelmatobacter sp.]|nr:hypothetical protein [Candidatus Sulfotelmatobacter sp.]